MEMTLLVILLFLSWCGVVSSHDSSKLTSLCRFNCLPNFQIYPPNLNACYLICSVDRVNLTRLMILLYDIWQCQITVLPRTGSACAERRPIALSFPATTLELPLRCLSLVKYLWIRIVDLEMFSPSSEILPSVHLTFVKSKSRFLNRGVISWEG